MQNRVNDRPVTSVQAIKIPQGNRRWGQNVTRGFGCPHTLHFDIFPARNRGQGVLKIFNGDGDKLRLLLTAVLQHNENPRFQLGFGQTRGEGSELPTGTQTCSALVLVVEEIACRTFIDNQTTLRTRRRCTPVGDNTKFIGVYGFTRGSSG